MHLREPLEKNLDDRQLKMQELGQKQVQHQYHFPKDRALQELQHSKQISKLTKEMSEHRHLLLLTIFPQKAKLQVAHARQSNTDRLLNLLVLVDFFDNQIDRSYQVKGKILCAFPSFKNPNLLLLLQSANKFRFLQSTKAPELELQSL